MSNVHLYIVYGCFYATVVQLSSSDGDQMTCKVENIYSLTLFREEKKKKTTSDVENFEESLNKLLELISE